MPKRSVSVTEQGIHIRVSDIAGKEAEFLTAVNECKEGRCACPSDEYSKLAGINVRTPGDGVEIDLQAKPGTALDPASINRCLDHTLGHLSDDAAAPRRAT